MSAARTAGGAVVWRRECPPIRANIHIISICYGDALFETHKLAHTLFVPITFAARGITRHPRDHIFNEEEVL
jgi:hypothetical protein